MSDKEKILAAIRKNKPAPKELPALPAFDRPGMEVVQAFIDVLPAIGAEVITDGGAVIDWPGLLQRISPEAERVLSLLPDRIPGNVDTSTVTGPRDLAGLDIAIVPGELGVAENGAIWISEEQLPFRVLPFITQHLVIVLSQKTIVADMHEAYRRLPKSQPGFGVFIAGPSKTADIEQALVKGAQGARSTWVVLVE